VWLTPHLRDPQPEGERERERVEGRIDIGAWMVYQPGDHPSQY